MSKIVIDKFQSINKLVSIKYIGQPISGILLNTLFQTTIMKVRNDEQKNVKEANKILRGLDFEDTLEGLTEQEVNI